MNWEPLLVIGLGGVCVVACEMPVELPISAEAGDGSCHPGTTTDAASTSTSSTTGGPDPGEIWYTTEFPLSERPLSEDGAWAPQTDPNQMPVQTMSGVALGTQDGASGYDDSIAFLEGSFPADQRVTCVIHKSGNSFNYHEVELWLRTSEGAERSTPFGPTSTYGYEVNIAWNGAYLQIGRFKELPALYDSFRDSQFRWLDVRDGSVFSAQVVGDTITVWLDGIVVATATDRTGSPFSEGAPGIGFYRQNSSGNINNETYGFRNFTASSVAE